MNMHKFLIITLLKPKNGTETCCGIHSEAKGLSDHCRKRGFVQSLVQHIPFATSSAIYSGCLNGFLSFCEGLRGSESSPITAHVSRQQPKYEIIIVSHCTPS